MQKKYLMMFFGVLIVLLFCVAAWVGYTFSTQVTLAQTNETSTPTNVCNPAWEYCPTPQTLTPAPTTTCDADFEICATPSTREPYPPPATETPHPYIPPPTEMLTGMPWSNYLETVAAGNVATATFETPTYTPTNTPTFTSTPTPTDTPTPTPTTVPTIPPPPTPAVITFSLGWNLVGFPDQPSYDAETLLLAINSQGGHCIEVVRWLNSQWNIHYRTYGNRFAILPFTGYFIYCSQGSTFMP